MISPERIRELKTEVGEDGFAEIVELFLSEADSMVDQLRSAAGWRDAEPLLHALKGSALNLGFSELGRLCRERRDPGSPAGDWPAEVDQIAAVYAESKARLRAMG